MNVYDWNALPEERLNPKVTRRVVHTERMTIAKLKLTKGAIVPLHHHENEQVTMMDNGALRFEIGGRDIIVRAGESLVIPSNVPHLVEALEDSAATDLFTPPRQDWISGDDAYLRK
ncbi:MAG TPA: cupin domain-containing protein [Bryobacteraceae bacterium]|nr:cupin domain-containing protein [Bryobacteraceae bacterium]